MNWEIIQSKAIGVLCSEETQNMLNKIVINQCRLHYFQTLNQLQQGVTNRTESNESSGKALDLVLIDMSQGLKTLEAQEWDQVNQLGIPFLVMVPEHEAGEFQVLKSYLQLGATDLFVHPIHPTVLAIKIESLLKNAPSAYLPDQLILKVDGHDIKDLTLKQAQLLSLFLKSKDRATQREEIMQKVWNDVSIHPKTIDVHLYNLRRKLANYGYMIKSVGAGRWALISQLK